jgi:NAD(P)-dependent dehydrogenase (short-subunit alcohol dehydrogenase family)
VSGGDPAGRAAFVAGGTSGINLAIAKSLAGAGMPVAVLSRNPARVDAAVAALAELGPAAAGYAADVRDPAAVERAIMSAADRFGRMDVVVSGAAGNFLCPAARLSPNAFKAVVDIDLLGTFHVFRAAYAVVTRPGASLISISAPQATEAHWGQAHVSAAKAGVDMLTRSLAAEWGPEGIRVNTLVPGPTEGTEGMRRLAPAPEARRAIEASIPLRRYATLDEVARAALFLASDDSSFVTGAILHCDGGAVLGGARPRPPAAVLAALGLDDGDGSR